ncbi:MAG: deoxyribose-phosphate aldolase [Deltaproteobacteria bacterium]|nr:MAG: deoxyribose-phosphate aldolase [Deltaproteobacteria bacterium]
MIDFNSRQAVAAIIDQTLLQPSVDRHQVQSFCEKAAELGFAAVCVAPCWVQIAVSIVGGSGVRVCTVAGFPLGFEPVEVKSKAAKAALSAGADELDYVVNLGAVKGDEQQFIAEEMKALRRAGERRVLKVILETGYLTRREKEWLCSLAVESGLDFVKTASGFGPVGATVSDVKLLAEHGQGRIKVKAAGGIRTLEDLEKMVLAGASRIGTSAGAEIVVQAGE